VNFVKAAIIVKFVDFVDYMIDRHAIVTVYSAKQLDLGSFVG
jgi:hypothetical protein